ncbi:MAG: 2-C-methyl-D-erythritol 4-phosphate cytidylyltransferase [Bacteroidetes bacterium]|nr:MAG: 2-C-methyl-D-erythritol 4-phosphate cytidylyltransferase [Bacteroidota bacterium]
MKKFAVIVAGGSGSRMGTDMPKQFLSLQGKPILQRSLEVFANTFPDIHFIVVLPEKYFNEGKLSANNSGISIPASFVSGGATRFESVRNGLAKVEKNSIVFVHDAVRCLVSRDLIERCYYQAVDKGSAIPAIEVKDSLRMVLSGRTEVIDRTKIRSIQTPQTFQSDILLAAFSQPYHESFTDEATVVESYGQAIHLIPGEEHNIKITSPIDLQIAEKILEGN